MCGEKNNKNERRFPANTAFERIIIVDVRSPCLCACGASEYIRSQFKSFTSSDSRQQRLSSHNEIIIKFAHFFSIHSNHRTYGENQFAKRNSNWHLLLLFYCWSFCKQELSPSEKWLNTQQFPRCALRRTHRNVVNTQVLSSLTRSHSTDENTNNRKKATNCKVFRASKSMRYIVTALQREMSAFAVVFSEHVIIALVHAAIEPSSALCNVFGRNDDGHER